MGQGYRPRPARSQSESSRHFDPHTNHVLGCRARLRSAGRLSQKAEPAEGCRASSRSATGPAAGEGLCALAVEEDAHDVAPASRRAPARRSAGGTGRSADPRRSGHGDGDPRHRRAVVQPLRARRLGCRRAGDDRRGRRFWLRWRSSSSTWRRPHVILVVGVNGTGKKPKQCAARRRAKLVNGELKVTLAAGDTFRAAAIERLE